MFEQLFFGEEESGTDSFFVLRRERGRVPIEIGALSDQTTPIVEGLGFRIVELNMTVVKGRTHVTLVIYSPDGVGIDDCATVHRTVLPRLELLLDDRDIALQVASPGIDRVLKSWSEFEVFSGRGVRVLRQGADDWLCGTVLRAHATEVEIASATGVVAVPHADIQKAKLDYTQEVR